MTERWPGLFLTFEGIDGAGKSTQIELLRRKLEAAGADVVVSREPTAGVWGRKLRESMTSGRLSLEDELEAFIHDRREHLDTLVLPGLKRGCIVILDRYYHSTLAYQGSRGADIPALKARLEALFPAPDLVIVLDVDPRQSHQRIAHGRQQAPNEFEKLEGLERARAVFRALDDAHVAHLDGAAPAAGVHAAVLGEVKRLLSGRAGWDSYAKKMMSLPAADPAAASPLTTPQNVMDVERAYLLQNYARYPLVLRKGKGCWVWDVDGRRYLDLISGIGVNSLGHAHPRINTVIREQIGLLIHTSNLYYHEYQGPLARTLCETSGMQRAFFTNSGAESMEGAIKMMHAHGRKRGEGKFEIVALENSFHGRTIGALSLTGQPKYRKDFEPLMPGVKFVAAHDLGALEAAVNDNTAGIVVEPIQGEGGVRPIGVEWLRRARELADRHDALLVFDEIQCGIGRPGAYYTYQLYEPQILPDVVVLAKPISCGLPMGAILANERAAASIAAGMHGTTFGGGALVCRVALEFFRVLDQLMPQMRRVSEYFFEGLRGLARKHSFVREVRGHGLMIGVELDFACKHLVQEGMAQGLLFNVTSENVIRMLPPYIITEKEVDRALRGLGRVFRTARPQP